jgi:hypothetical protein
VIESYFHLKCTLMDCCVVAFNYHWANCTAGKSYYLHVCFCRLGAAMTNDSAHGHSRYSSAGSSIHCLPSLLVMNATSSKTASIVAIAVQLILTGMLVVSKAAFNQGMNTFVFVFYRQAALAPSSCCHLPCFCTGRSNQ